MSGRRGRVAIMIEGALFHFDRTPTEEDIADAKQLLRVMRERMEAEPPPMSVACSKCGRGVDERCVFPGNPAREIPGFHLERRAAAKVAAERNEQ